MPPRTPTPAPKGLAPKGATAKGATAGRASSAPRPGQHVRGSRTGRPIMALFDLAGRAWTLWALWELAQAGGPITFRDLRDRCEQVSSSVLSRRLNELRDAKLVQHEAGGYALTDLGRGLIASLEPLTAWSRGWAKALQDG